MAKEKYQTRLPADTADEVDDYIAEREISQAEGIRRLVESGLKAEAEPGDEPNGQLERAHQRGTLTTAIIIGLLTLNLVLTLGVI